MGRKARGSAQEVRLCANCGCPVAGSDARVDGDAVAWYWHCQVCSQLAAKELDLIVDQPNGISIQIYRCRRCGAQRSCRPGWLTRCHICLDERSHGPLITDAAQRFRATHAGDAGLRMQTRLLSAVAGRDSDQAAVEASAALVLAAAVRPVERPGWDILATDVHGLPWTGSKTAATRTEPGPSTSPVEPSLSYAPAASTARPAGRPTDHIRTWPAATTHICCTW